MLGTATVTCGPTLRATVKVLREINEMFFEVEVIEGSEGWNKPGKVLGVRASIMSDFVPVDETPEALTPAPEVDESAPLTEPVTGEQYMEILLQRQATWMTRNGGMHKLPPLLEWFIREGDEDFVQLPDATPAPKRERTPRTYRSAASLREDRDRVQAQMDAITGSGPDDPASVNLSPFSRSKAAASAGRRRFAKLDRDLEKFTALAQRLATLDFRILSAEAREQKAVGQG
jgi:hypothetical protein